MLVACLMAYVCVCCGLLPSPIFRGGSVRFSVFSVALASCILFGCLLGIALLEINS